MLSYWSSRAETGDVENQKAARARHVLWIVEHSPKDDLFRTATRVAQIYLSGRLADAITFEAIKRLWLRHLQKSPDDEQLIVNAGSWFELQAPEDAERLYIERGKSRVLGFLYAHWILGIAAEDFATGDPIIVEESRRTSPFAQRAREILQTSDNAGMLSGAAFALAWKGGILFADGKLTWDYTEMLAPLLARAQARMPLDLALFAISPTLPRLGQRPPRVLSAGGVVMSKKLRKKVQPAYPPEAKMMRIEGTVRLRVIVGLKGEIARAVVASGPRELEAAALAAVERQYEPTLLSGKPVFMITVIDLHFRL